MPKQTSSCPSTSQSTTGTTPSKWAQKEKHSLTRRAHKNCHFMTEYLEATANNLVGLVSTVGSWRSTVSGGDSPSVNLYRYIFPALQTRLMR